MSYNKYLIVASKLDRAGINITTQLSQFKPLATKKEFKFYLPEKEILYTENLDLEKINEYDFIVFASRHASEKREKTISIHAPGNWRIAEFGGVSGKVCKTSALFQKFLFENLNLFARKYNLKNYQITMECTHHGPLIEKPCIFLEIGSTENEWKDLKAGFVVAKALYETITNFKENPYREIAIAIGGNHYCSSFNKIQETSNIAISHVIPKYALPLTESMVKEAIEKTEEEVDFALLDWKGLGSREQRQNVLDILDRLYVRYEKTGSIRKC